MGWFLDCLKVESRQRRERIRYRNSTQLRRTRQQIRLIQWRFHLTEIKFSDSVKRAQSPDEEWLGLLWFQRNLSTWDLAMPPTSHGVNLEQQTSSRTRTRKPSPSSSSMSKSSPVWAPGSRHAGGQGSNRVLGHTRNDNACGKNPAFDSWGSNSELCTFGSGCY